MSAQDFLDRYWHKAPLFLPNALTGDLPTLSADELAWLATLDDVESRLVFTEQNHRGTRYRVEHGPFDDQTLGALPPKDWTLLVQDVEKHLPELRRYLQQASFIPDWRIDDLMVSCAAPGGSVGPHRDNYDVFLCQGSGRREWRLAPFGANLKSIDSGGLSLLEPFVDRNPITAREGDVVYLPPGIAHWGLAMDACMTYSIGMRAPQASDFGASNARPPGHVEAEEQDSGDLFYHDPDLTPAEAEPGFISVQAIERARSCFAAAEALSDGELVRRFGRVVTEPKAWLTPEAPAVAAVDALLKSPAGTSRIRVHGMARLAFHAGDSNGMVFANGSSTSASPRQLEFFRRLCATREMQSGEIQSAIKDAEICELLKWLIVKGAFDRQFDARDCAT